MKKPKHTPKPAVIEAEPPVAEIAAPKAAPIPRRPVPDIVTKFARFVEGRWGVPAWLSIAVMAVATDFGANTPAPHNWCGVRASGTGQQHPSGYAWYPSVIAGADAFGHLCARTEPMKGAIARYHEDKDGAALVAAFRAYNPDIHDALTSYIEGD